MKFKLNNFDLLRLVAACQVLIGHSLTHFDVAGISWLDYFPGVPVFFVISGFLISASWERSNSVLTYFENRFLRIYPALWCCFFFSVFMLSLTYDFDILNLEFLKWAIAQLTVVQFYNPGFLRDYGVGVVNGSLWTIPVELQFYLLLPFFYMFMHRFYWNKFLFLFIIIIFSLINFYKYQMALNDNNFLVFKLFSVTVIPYFNMFLLGVFFQRNIQFVERYLENKFPYWFLFYIGSVVFSEFVGISNSGNSINPISALILSLMVISAAYSCVDLFGNILGGHDISYGIYIYHMVVINFLLHVDFFNDGINVFFTVVITIFVSFLSWMLLEKPMLSLKRVKSR